MKFMLLSAQLSLVMMTGLAAFNAKSFAVEFDLHALEARIHVPAHAHALRADLKLEMQARLRTFERPVRFYHYGNRGPIRHSTPYPDAQPNDLRFNDQEAIDLKRGALQGVAAYQSPVELQPEEAKVYFQTMSGHFANQEPDWLIGQGLYAAVDPVQSEIYMGNPWFLLEVKVPTGMHYLDVRPEGGIIISEAFVRKWIVPESGRSFERFQGARVGPHSFRLSIFSLLELEGINRIFQSLVEELEVDALAYPWAKHTIAHCQKLSQNEDIAFNFMNPRALNRGLELKTFVQELEPSATLQKKAEYSRVLDLIEASDLHISNKLTLNASFWTGEMAQARLLTMGWSRALSRTPLLASLFPAPETLQLLNDVFILKKPADFPLLLPYADRYRITADSVVQSTELGELSMHPMMELRAKGPAPHAARIRLIESTVFGCHPAFPKEHLTPEN